MVSLSGLEIDLLNVQHSSALDRPTVVVAVSIPLSDDDDCDWRWMGYATRCGNRKMCYKLKLIRSLFIRGLVLLIAVVYFHPPPTNRDLCI